MFPPEKSPLLDEKVVRISPLQLLELLLLRDLDDALQELESEELE